MSLLSVLICDIVYIESEGNDMKRNRHSMGYKVWKIFHDLKMKEVGNLIFDFITMVAFLAALFLLPHFLH